MPYKCNECGKGFPVKELLRLLARVQSGKLVMYHIFYRRKPLFLWRMCKKHFPGGLIVHQRVHSGDKPYKCGECDAESTSSENLKTHTKLHKNSKEFQCPLCVKGVCTKPI